MTFDEAMQHVAKGHEVRRPGWADSVALQEHTAVLFGHSGGYARTRMLCSNYCAGQPIGRHITPFAVSDEALAANDWELVL